MFATAVFQASIRKQLSDATAAFHESRRPLPDLELITDSPASSWREWLLRVGLAARSGP
ncbi:MAG: hypothetical protein QM621_04205 [Aeromicrobium sp.]|uniref:hypothetical protein n=1 Tax=Aeromicrobium sp. TaxID=1871063 RepID=UPI0039E30E1B